MMMNITDFFKPIYKNKKLSEYYCLECKETVVNTINEGLITEDDAMEVILDHLEAVHNKRFL